MLVLLAKLNKKVVFVTNNSTKTLENFQSKRFLLSIMYRELHTHTVASLMARAERTRQCTASCTPITLRCVAGGARYAD